MSNKTKIVKIENAIGRKLTDAEFWNVGERIYNALCNGGRNEAANEVEVIIRELKAA